MSFVDNEILKAFASERSWLTAEVAAGGVEEAILQSDDIIYQHTGIAAPESAADANPTLRNLACALVIWFTTGQQAKIEEQELKRRQDMYNASMKVLAEIRAGDLILMDAEGSPITGQSESQSIFSSTQRLDQQL